MLKNKKGTCLGWNIFLSNIAFWCQKVRHITNKSNKEILTFLFEKIYVENCTES